MQLVEGGRESTAELAAGLAYFRAAGVEHDVINDGVQHSIFVECPNRRCNKGRRQVERLPESALNGVRTDEHR
jgi:hypothetical protein